MTDTKICTKCRIEKSFEEFAKDKKGKFGRSARCKTCACRHIKENRHRLPCCQYHTKRNDKLKYQYGITIEIYNKMFDEQKGCCAICGKHQTELGRTLGVDHNHKSKKVRQLLCDVCNRFVAHVEDYPDLLPKVQGYLEKHVG